MEIFPLCSTRVTRSIIEFKIIFLVCLWRSEYLKDLLNGINMKKIMSYGVANYLVSQGNHESFSSAMTFLKVAESKGW